MAHSLFNAQWVDHIYLYPYIQNAHFKLHDGDLTSPLASGSRDSSRLRGLVYNGVGQAITVAAGIECAGAITGTIKENIGYDEPDTFI